MFDIMSVSDAFGYFCELVIIYLFVICPITAIINGKERKKEKKVKEEQVISEVIPQVIDFLSQYNAPVLYAEYWNSFCEKTFDKYIDYQAKINEVLLQRGIIYRQGRYISLTSFE